MEKCKWCPNEAINSHVIPGSILKASRKFMGVTNIRSLSQPNLELQDLPTAPLLCKTCDNSFSSAENNFIHQIYKPLHTGSKKFAYDEWLTKFAISLAWKRLTISLPHLSDLRTETRVQATKALDHWQGYLLNEHAETKPHQHHLFLTAFIDKGEISEKHRIMLMTTMEANITSMNVGLLVQTNLPGCSFLSIIEPKNTLPVWKGTEIMPNGTFDDNQILSGSILFHGFRESSKHFQKAAAKISPRQRRKMGDKWPLIEIGDLDL